MHLIHSFVFLLCVYRSTFGARYFSGVSLLCLCHSACLLLCLGVFGFRHSKRERHTTDRQTAERDRETNQDRTLPGTLVGRLECVAADFHLFLYVLLQGVAILFLLSSLTQRPCPMLHGSSLFSFSFNCFFAFQLICKYCYPLRRGFPSSLFSLCTS